MGIIAAFSSLLVFVMMASTVNARVINKRAAFYIANDTMCIVDGELYYNGDPVPTDDHCEKCTCRPPGFSCVLRDCEVKPGCKAVRKDGECCPDYICGCSHNGNVYKDGDFIRDLQNPCYTCRCHGSSISCTFADCLFRSDCGPEYIQGECCPRYDHCPPLSTTQKSTTVITTVPITYDETTKPLFNLTSPPHERLATHTTIFPTTGMATVESGETHTTETFVKPSVSDVSTEAAQTTRVHHFTVTPSSESSTSSITQGDTSTVTTVASKDVSETSSEVDKDSSQKPVFLGDETTSTESFSTDTTLSATNVKTDTEAKDLTSTPITAELSSEGDLFPEELQDGQSTETSHDRQTEEAVTEASHDRQTDESVTEESHGNQVDDLVIGVSHDNEDEPETELSSGSHTTELVTEVSHDKQTDESVEELSHGAKTDLTPVESDETVTMSFSEERSKATFEVTKEDESKDITQSIDDSVETSTEMHTTHEELKVSSEDEVLSSHEAFSSQPELVGGSEGTSPSLVSTVTMSGDSEAELSPEKSFTATETRGITTYDTHNGPVVSDASITEVQETSTSRIREDVIDTSLPSVTGSDDHRTSHDDHQTESEVEDKTTFSGSGHSDFGNSESSTMQSETKQSFSIGSTDDDDDDFIDEPPTDEDEINTQDAEELSLFTGAVTPSEGIQQKATTILDHISHQPSSEATQTVTNELVEEQSVDASKLAEDRLQTEQTEAIDSNVGDVGSLSSSVPHIYLTTTTHSAEVPLSPQHTRFVLDGHKTTTAQSVYTSSDVQDETTISEGRNNDDVEQFLSSLFTEDANEKNSDVSQSTTEHFPDHVRPLNEIAGQENAAIAGTEQSSSEDHEAPHLLSEDVNALSPTDEINTEGDDEAEGSSQSSAVVTTEGTTETVITMEAESDLSLTASRDSSTTAGAEDVSITSFRVTEPSEGLSVLSESITTVRAAETPVTLTSLPEVSSTELHESTDEHIAEDDLTIKPKEHELLLEESHFTSTVPPQQDTSDFNKNSDTTLNTAEIPSDDLDHSKQLTEVSSTIIETDDHVTSEKSTLTTSAHISGNTVTASTPEESNDGSTSDVSLTTISTTTKSSESPASSPKQVTEEPKPTDIYDNDENTAASAHLISDGFNKAEEQHDTQKESTLINELTTDSQRNTGSQITENTSEITMDAEESIMNNGFESITDYLHVTENYEGVSTAQDHAAVGKEDSDTQDHYTVDGETYIAPSGEHLRVSRSTSSNSMSSSITAQYPEKLELQTLHSSETENETTGASTTAGISVSSFGNTAVTDDENKSVTESLHSETTQTTPTSIQDNSLDSTHSTYLNSVEVSSLSSDPSNENLSTSPNTDDSYVSQVTKLISYEAEGPNGDDSGLNIGEAEETFEDGPKEEVPVASTVEISPSAEPTAGLLKDSNIAPDLIIPVEHQVNAFPFNSAETEFPILSDHSTDVTKEHVSNPSTTLTPKFIASTSDSEISGTENGDSSESYDNNALETESNDDIISRFSRTSERYSTEETVVDNEASASTTENHITISSYTMDAEAETSYFDDSTGSNKEGTEHQTPSDSEEEEELIGKEFQDGPEKGGEWFEPTVPVLSAISVHKSNDETSTHASRTVKYYTSTDSKEAVTVKNEERTFFVTDVVDQIRKTHDNENAYSSNLPENQSGELTITTSNVRDFTNNIDEEVINTKSTKEVPSPNSVPYETTHLGAADDLEHDTNSHQFFHSSEPDSDLNANKPTNEEPQENDSGTIVSENLTFIGDEVHGSSSEGLNPTTSSEVKELDETETDEDKLLEQTVVNRITREHTIKLDQTEDSIQTTTAKTNSISQRDEVESSTASEVQDRGGSKNDDLREQKEIKDEPIYSSQHDTDNVGSETTKESGTFLNDFMLSDGVGGIMRFTDVITDGSDLITDHISTTDPLAVDEDLEKDFENAGSQGEEFDTDPEHANNDEVLYAKGSSEENASEESTTTKVDSNGLAESEQTSVRSAEGGHSLEQSTESSVSLGDHAEESQHKNDDYSTEHFSTFYYKSTTPLPLLLFNEFVERVKEDSLLNRNAQPDEEQHSTIKPEEISDLLSELVSDEKAVEDLENDSETTVVNDHEISTPTQRNSDEHASSSTTPSSQEKQTEISSTSSRLEEFTSQDSYSTENAHSDHSLDETEKVPDSTEGSHTTEQNNKSEKNVSRVFFIRRSHPEYVLDEERPHKKEESTAEKDGVVYSVKSPEIAVKNPDETTQEEEHDKVSVTTELVTQHNELSTDDTHQRDFHDSGLDSTSTSKSSVEPTSTKIEDATASESSDDETFHHESTEVAQNNEDEQLKDEHDDDVSGSKTTPDPMNSDTA